jgi:hypothetical protein
MKDLDEKVSTIYVGNPQLLTILFSTFISFYGKAALRA